MHLGIDLVYGKTRIINALAKQNRDSYTKFRRSKSVHFNHRHINLSGSFVRSFTLRRVELILLLDNRRRLRDVLAEDLGLDEPGQPDGEFVADEFLGWDVEDLCVCVLV